MPGTDQTHNTTFLLTCLLRGMTVPINYDRFGFYVSTHMPLARHDVTVVHPLRQVTVSTHMPLARHDLYWDLLAREILAFLLTCLLRGMTVIRGKNAVNIIVSTHMPLARHDKM